jgi:hypothetical protein
MLIQGEGIKGSLSRKYNFGASPHLYAAHASWPGPQQHLLRRRDTKGLAVTYGHYWRLRRWLLLWRLRRCYYYGGRGGGSY